MSLEQALITWAHLISASIWVGGSIFLGAILAPSLRGTSMSMQERMIIMVRVGRQFNKVAIPSLAVLVGTGLYNSYRIIPRLDTLLDTDYGILLTIKIVLVAVMIVAFVAHISIMRNDAVEKLTASTTSDDAKKLRKKIIILGEVITVLSIVILLLAAMLDTGV